jgi:hypothetical protein
MKRKQKEETEKDKSMSKIELYVTVFWVAALLVLITMFSSCSSSPSKKQVEQVQAQESSICPVTKIVLGSNIEWDDRLDRPNFNIASKRCAELYKNSPCLTVFTKIEFQRYWARCGAKNSQMSISEDK